MNETIKPTNIIKENIRIANLKVDEEKPVD